MECWTLGICIFSPHSWDCEYHQESTTIVCYRTIGIAASIQESTVSHVGSHVIKCLFFQQRFVFVFFLRGGHISEWSRHPESLDVTQVSVSPYRSLVVQKYCVLWSQTRLFPWWHQKIRSIRHRIRTTQVHPEQENGYESRTEKRRIRGRRGW